MATFTATRAKNSAPRAGTGGSTQVITVVSEYAITAALALNDVIQMVKVPSGAQIVGMTLGATDLDTGGSPAIVLDVGDGDDTDRFIDGATVGQAGGSTSALAVAGFGYTYTAEDTIDVLVQVAPATGATTGTITLRVDYMVDALT